MRVASSRRRRRTWPTYSTGAKIRTIIDLRNDDEIEKSAASASPYGRALLDAYDRGAPVGAGQIASEGSGVLQRLNVPILCDADGFLDEVANRLGPAAKAKAAMVRTFDGKGYDRILYDDIAKKRQLGLYTVMLKTSAEFGNALEAVASRRQSGNVLIHCAKGKDRTGVLAALLQHVAGDDEKDILEAYAASEGFAERTRKGGASVHGAYYACAKGEGSAAAEEGKERGQPDARRDGEGRRLDEHGRLAARGDEWDARVAKERAWQHRRLSCQRDGAG